MKSATKVIIALIIIILIPMVIGFFQPKERLIIEKVVIDKMYFFILSDITNHWEEPQWRHNIDTIIQDTDFAVSEGKTITPEHTVERRNGLRTYIVGLTITALALILTTGKPAEAPKTSAANSHFPKISY